MDEVEAIYVQSSVSKEVEEDLCEQVSCNVNRVLGESLVFEEFPPRNGTSCAIRVFPNIQKQWSRYGRM